ncbi:MAG: DUF6796 family protein [Rhizobiaceae bacterium]
MKTVTKSELYASNSRYESNFQGRDQNLNQKSMIMWTGICGLLAAITVGLGEFLLHYDPLARYGQSFDFFLDQSESHSTIGHFFGVLGAPLYVLGAVHIYMMLRPASNKLAAIAALIMAYGCIIGAVWIGSRSTASMIINLSPESVQDMQLALYEFRYETLLTVVRIAVLVLSVIFVWLILTGRTNYPRAMAILNPIFLILVSFGIFFSVPAVGKFLMPIALNVAFLIIFAVSTWIAIKQHSGEDV